MEKNQTSRARKRQTRQKISKEKEDKERDN